MGRSRIMRRFRSYGIIIHIPRGPYTAFRCGYLHRTRYHTAMHYHWTTRPIYRDHTALAALGPQENQDDNA
jgi:hypothetical protein